MPNPDNPDEAECQRCFDLGSVPGSYVPCDCVQLTQVEAMLHTQREYEAAEAAEEMPDIEVVDIHYELEFRFDEDQPWTTETHYSTWLDPITADEWAAKWRPHVQHRVVQVQRTPVQP